MTRAYLLIISILITVNASAQVIQKPRGCFAGTNGTAAAVLMHAEARGALVIAKWSEIETQPGQYDFSSVDLKVNSITAVGKKYALAISIGAFGSPSWLIDSLQVGFHSFQYQNQNWRLPLWWDSTCMQQISTLISEVANRYASDSMLSHVYVSQMTVNGVEGHLNGVDMNAFRAAGFSEQKWIAAAKQTSLEFATAFPDKPIVFELHEIDQDTLVPAAIVNELKEQPALCRRFGIAMWWLSGKTTYQTKLVDFIWAFPGDKYAQLIGRSDQLTRFKDSLYASAFSQAKDLNIRYLEPWPYEFQNHTHDSLIVDYNAWADLHFQATDTCFMLSEEEPMNNASQVISIYPNPCRDMLYIQSKKHYKSIAIELYTSSGQLLYSGNKVEALDLGSLPHGLYYLIIVADGRSQIEKVLKI